MEVRGTSSCVVGRAPSPVAVGEQGGVYFLGRVGEGGRVRIDAVDKVILRGGV